MGSSTVKKRWSLSKQLTGSSALKQKTNNLSLGSLSPNIYSSIKELPLGKFWDVCVTGDVFLLVKSEKHEREDLERAWQIIGYEYAEAMEMNSAGSEAKTEYSCEFLRFKANLVADCVEFLKLKHSESIIGVLKKMFPTLKFEWDNKDAFNKDMIRVIGISKNWIVEYMAMEDSLSEADKERMSKAGANTLNQYYESLAILKEHYHISYDLSRYTVLEYCIDSKRIIKQNIAAKKAAEKNGRNGRNS